MLDLPLIPSEDVAILLNTLLDVHERRRSPSPQMENPFGDDQGSGVRGMTRSIKCSLRDLPLPNYFSQIDPNPRKTANEQLQILEQAGWLRLEWQPGETSHLLEGVAMPPDCAPPIFKLLNRVPLNQKRAQLASLILGERFRFHGDWRQRAIRHILTQIRAGKSPAPFSLVDQQFSEDLLVVLGAVETLTVETPYRIFSVRLFNDSKRFEELKSALVRLVRLGHREWRELSSRDVLRELNLVPNPDYLYLSGQWRLVDDLGQVISLGEFSPSVGIPAAQAARLQRVTVQASKIICVENPTSFHELIRKTEYAILRPSTGQECNMQSSIAAICLWGNPSPTCRHLLGCVAENLPGNTPLQVWADLDYGGFNILAMLRKHVNPRFQPYMMDIETLEEHSLWANPLTQRDQRNLKRLSINPALKDVKPVIMHLIQRNLKLEQEAITIPLRK